MTSNYKCKICLIEFESFKELESHIETSHSQNEQWRNQRDFFVLRFLKSKEERESRKYRNRYGL